MNQEILLNFLEILLTSLTAAGALYVKTKFDMRKICNEIKHHSDVTMKKFNGTLTYMFSDMPCPMYAKEAVLKNGGVEFRYLELNDKYAKRFGFTREQCLGKTDVEIGLPKHIADEAYQRNLRVWSTKTQEPYIKIFPDGAREVFRQGTFSNDQGEVMGLVGFGVSCMVKDIENLAAKINKNSSKNKS